jgi:hypothetical protein
MSDGPSLLWTLIAIERVPRAPTVAAAGRLPIATEGYGPSVHRRIVVLISSLDSPLSTSSPL